jgi:hypothetical protein
MRFSKGFICLADKKKIYFYKKNDILITRIHLIEIPSLLVEERNQTKMSIQY